MKKIVLLISSIVCAIATFLARADAEKMILTTSDGANAFEVNTLTKISFNDNQLTVITPEGSQSFNVLDVESIAFDLSGGVDDVLAKDFEDGVGLALSNGSLTVTASGEDITVAIYSVKGALVNRHVGHGSLTIDLTRLAAGVYSVKANNKTLKFVK